MDIEYLMSQISNHAGTENRSTHAIECYAVAMASGAKTKVSPEDIHRLCMHAESLCDKREPLGELGRS